MASLEEKGRGSQRPLEQDGVSGPTPSWAGGLSSALLRVPFSFLYLSGLPPLWSTSFLDPFLLCLSLSFSSAYQAPLLLQRRPGSHCWGARSPVLTRSLSPDSPEAPRRRGPRGGGCKGLFAAQTADPEEAGPAKCGLPPPGPGRRREQWRCGSALRRREWDRTRPRTFRRSRAEGGRRGPWAGSAAGFPVPEALRSLFFVPSPFL